MDESSIKKHAKAVEQRKNTIFLQTYIQHNKNEFQAHLERINDYLMCGNGVWWTHVPQGIEFMDGDKDNTKKEGLQMSHFNCRY